MSKKALVLLSGGQDSTVCLLIAIRMFGNENVEAISYIYNHNYRKDIECSKRICKLLNIKQHIFDISIIREIAESNSFEGRNLLLISMAAIFANTHSFNQIFIGVTADDVIGSVIHPDCSIEFVDSLKKCLAISLDSPIEVITPLIYSNKKDIWKIADEIGYLDFVKDETFSCWDNNDNHCMKCRACELRFKSLESYEREKMIKESINYVSWNTINNVIIEMSKQIESKFQPDIIITIVRGGMVPTVMLSHKLGIRYVECVYVRETKSDQINSLKHEPILEISEDVVSKCSGKKILIVDDIVGSGKTIQLVKEQIQKSLPEKIMTAVCYVNQLNWQKNNTSNVYEFIDFIGRIAYGWVVFPWEINDE